jgi:mannose-1-phosphate guanylyltransferase
MKALILVGGYGTRLRPLTLTVPKPIVDFANKPMIIHQIEALKDAGCSEVVLAINYQPKVMMAFLSEWEAKLNIKITCSQETEPMGTAGPLALARDILDDKSGDPFFVLNSDVICDFPLKEMLKFHKESKAEGTILVTRVEDPSKYGVVVTDEKGCVERFVEKPKTFVGDRINAGIYCLSPQVLDRIELRPTSIEKETFPLIARDQRLYAFTLPGYWMDVGQPKDYLTGLQLHLDSLSHRHPEQLAKGPEFIGNNIVHPTAKIGKDCAIGPNVSIGIECEIGDGVRIRDSVLLHRVKVHNYARMADSIVGWGSSLGKWSRLENKAVIGEDVHVKPEIFLNGAIVLPHKEIKESIMDPGTIIM